MIIAINSASGKDYRSIDKTNDGCLNQIDYDEAFKNIGWNVNKVSIDNVPEEYKDTYAYECFDKEYNRYVEVDNLNKLPELINKVGSIIINPISHFVNDMMEHAIGKKIDLEITIYDYWVE